MGHLEFGEWLARSREEIGISQRELARQLDVSNTLISKVERGDMPASWELCHKLSKLWKIEETEVRRYAGLEGYSIPDEPNFMPEAHIFQEIIKDLSPQRRQEILEVVKVLGRQRSEAEQEAANERGKAYARASMQANAKKRPVSSQSNPRASPHEGSITEASFTEGSPGEVNEEKATV